VSFFIYQKFGWLYSFFIRSCPANAKKEQTKSPNSKTKAKDDFPDEMGSEQA